MTTADQRERPGGAYLARVSGLLRDLRIAVSFLTRVPVAPPELLRDGELARASWAFPVAGALIGAAAAVAYWLAARLHIPTSSAAVLALATTILLTGAMHEDGLADTADGFGGGRTRDKKLEIMRDSRIGTFGACAIGLSLMLRWSALAALDNPRSVAIGLIAAHIGARAVLPAFMTLVPPARSEGLGHATGLPPPPSVALALGIGIVALSIGFGVGGAVTGTLLLATTGLALATLARRQIGGMTGDVLGALEQGAEAGLLLLATTLA